VPRAAKPFCIPVVHSPPGLMGYVSAPDLPSQEGRAPNRGTRSSIEAPLSGRQSLEPWDTWQHRSSPLRKAELSVMGHVAAPELTSSRRQGPELRDTWQHRSSPQRRSCGTRGGAGAHLWREVWSEGTTYVATSGCTTCSLSWLRACMRGYPVFMVPTEAPGPTSGEAVNLQVGPTLRAPLGYLEFVT
jgi:hypothetical protein